MYIDVSFPRPSSSPRLGILVHWLPIDSVLLTEPSHYSKTNNNSTLRRARRGLLEQVNWQYVRCSLEEPTRPTDPDRPTLTLAPYCQGPDNDSAMRLLSRPD